MGADMTLEGMDVLLTRLQRKRTNTSRVENKAIRAGAAVIQNAVSRHAPRSDLNHEHLADNIIVSKVKTIDGVKVVLIGPQKGDNSRFFYGKFLEWGTLKMSARPFMGPGAAEARRPAIEATKEVLKEALRE